MEQTTQGTEKLLTAAAVAELLSISKRQVFRLQSAGLICAPITIGRKSVRWKWSDIDFFIRCDGDMDKFNAMKAK